MLELAGSKAFGVHISQFLEREAPLGYRVAHVAAQEQEGVVVS